MSPETGSKGEMAALIAAPLLPNFQVQWEPSGMAATGPQLLISDPTGEKHRTNDMALHARLCWHGVILMSDAARGSGQHTARSGTQLPPHLSPPLMIGSAL